MHAPPLAGCVLPLFSRSVRGRSSGGGCAAGAAIDSGIMACAPVFDSVWAQPAEGARALGDVRASAAGGCGPPALGPRGGGLNESVKGSLRAKGGRRPAARSHPGRRAAPSAAPRSRLRWLRPARLKAGFYSLLLLLAGFSNRSFAHDFSLPAGAVAPEARAGKETKPEASIFAAFRSDFPAGPAQPRVCRQRRI